MKITFKFCILNSFMLIIFIFSKAIYAEILLKDTVMYDKPAGEEVYKITAPLLVQPLNFNEDNAWVKVRFLSAIDKIKTDQKLVTLISGNIIYNARKTAAIGIVKDEVIVPLSPLYNEDFDKITILEVTGYVNKVSLQGGSLLEDDLNEIIISQKKLTPESFEKHLYNFNYQKWISDDSFKSFFVQGDGVRDPSPRPRVVLFFYENNLIAISHQREYIFNQYINRKGIRGESISISPNLKEITHNKFLEYYKSLMMQID